MAKKTFRIGEYAKGGIIVAIVNSEDITLECRDWDTKKLIFEETSDDEVFLMNVLFDWTSFYYQDVIMSWVRDNQPKKARII